jgi:RNA polymerase sigma-70 factor (ECF subfamily)
VSETAEALLERFVRQRAEADFRPLYDRVTPGMLGLAMRLCGGDRATAEDIVQESWYRAIDRVDRFERGGSVARWLNGFVVRCWSESRRATLREVTTDNADIESIAATRDAAAWSEAPLLRQAVNALPEGFRAVLVLHDIEGFTHAEIAERLGIDEGTSKSQLSRARRRVRVGMGETG